MVETLIALPMRFLKRVKVSLTRCLRRIRVAQMDAKMKMMKSESFSIAEMFYK